MGEKQGGFLTLETIAHNRRISRRGMIPIDKNAPSTLKPLPIVSNLRKTINRKSLNISADAGTYLCNYIYYKTLSSRPDIPALFLHICALDKQNFHLQEKKYLTGLLKVIHELAKAIDGAGANYTSREN